MCYCLLGFFFLPGIFGSVSFISVKIAVRGAFSSLPLITSHCRVDDIACIPGLFLSSLQLHCFSLCADLVFVFLFWLFSLAEPLPVALCLHFLRFRSAFLYTLACKLDSCNPQALVWCFQSSMWTQLWGEEHWSSVSWFLIKICCFSGEIRAPCTSSATVIVWLYFWKHSLSLLEYY